jgi:hypothetical protein
MAPRGFTLVSGLFSFLCTLGAQSFDQGTSAPINQNFAIQEYQLQGEVIGDPRWIPGFGLLIATDDRRLSLVDPVQQRRRHWTLPRLPRGQPQASLNGVAGVTLSDGRLAIVNLRGGLIRIQAAPAPDGVWLLSPEARICWLGLRRIELYNLCGDFLGGKDHGHSIQAIEGVEVHAYRVVLSDQRKGIILKDGNFIAHDSFYSMPKNYQLSVWPGRYRIESEQGLSRFSHEANAGFGFVVSDPKSGWLSWTDARWKLFMVALAPRPEIVLPVIPEPLPMVKEIDRQLLRLAHDHPKGDIQEVIFDFKYRLSLLQDIEWFRTLILEIILDDGNQKYPRFWEPTHRQNLLTLFRLLVTAQDIPLISRWIQAHRHDFDQILDLVEAIGLDPGGDLVTILERIIDTKTIRPSQAQRVLRLIQNLLPSLPESSLGAYFTLMSRLRVFSALPSAETRALAV